MAKLFSNRIIKSNKGISIILAIIIIIILGLAGSIFSYLIASGSIVSRSNLLSAEAKYAAKSGVEITLYQIKNGGAFSTNQPNGCPSSPVVAQETTTAVQYLSGNLQGKLLSVVNYTPTFCAVEGELGSSSNCTYYAVTSNGFAGGTKREIAAEVGVKNSGGGGCTGIYVESEPPN